MKKNSYLKVANFTFLIVLLLNAVIKALAAPLPMPAPLTINIEPKGLSANVQWTYPTDYSPPSAGAEFEISYTENGGSPVIAGTTAWSGVKDYQYTVSGLIEGRTYVFSVKAKIGVIYESSSISSGNYVPALFTGNIGISVLNTTPNSVKVQIGDQTSGATSYNLFYKIKGGGSATAVNGFPVVKGTVNNYDVNGLSPNTTYEIWIVATNGSDNKTSNVAEFKTKRTAPASPVTAYFNNDAACPGSITLRWQFNDHTQVDTYVIYDEFTNQIVGSGFPAAGQMSQKITTIPGRAYKFVIHATNESGTGYSPSLTVASPQYEAPIGPRNISEGYDITDKGFTMSWVNQNEDVACNNRIRDQYEFVLDITYRDGTTAQLRRYAFKNDNIKVFTEGDGMKPGAKVTVTMAAVNTFFNFRGYGDRSITVILLGPPYDPYNPAMAVSENALGQLQADFSWTSEIANHEVGGKTGSIIEILNEDGSVKEKITTNFDFEKFVIKPVEEGETITARVADYNKYGVSGFTSPISIQVPYSKAPVSPAGLTAAEKNGAVVLVWRDGSSREAETIIERSTDDGTTWTEIGRVAKNVTTYTDANVTDGETYGYRVIASNSVGSSAPSKEEWISLGESAQGMINVFPNPTADVLNLKIGNTTGKGQVTIVDQNNRAVMKKGITLKNGEGTINISNLVPGAYQVVIEAEGVETSKKVFKY